MTHLRLQRTRARDAVWLIEGGATLHDDRDGEPMHDATQRWLMSSERVVAEVDRLVRLYDELNATPECRAIVAAPPDRDIMRLPAFSPDDLPAYHMPAAVALVPRVSSCFANEPSKTL
jgi:hypothetical protein